MRAPRRIGYPHVVATIALFISLGGTSYAIVRLPKNSVGTVQLRDRAVTPAKLAAGTLTRGPRGLQGPAGANGAAGQIGPQGPAGPAGPADVYTTTRGQVPLPATADVATSVATLSLPAGTYWVAAAAYASYQDSGGSGSAYFRCWLTNAGQGFGAVSVARIGQDLSAARSASVATQGGSTLTKTSTVTLTCNHDTNLPAAGGPRMESIELTAIRTGNLQVQ